MANVEVQNPRLPSFGQAVGPAGGISSDVYEQFAPQMGMTEFQTDLSRTGYEMSKDIESERQRQEQARIAQAKRSREMAMEAQRKAQKRKKKSGLWSGIGSLVGGVGGFIAGGPAGAIKGAKIGGSIGGAGAAYFGAEGGMVPGVHPRSLLYKHLQSGGYAGDVTGYKSGATGANIVGGGPKFLRSGYQGLQMTEQNLEEMQSNLNKALKPTLGSVLAGGAQGYQLGSIIGGAIPKAKSMLDLARSSYGLAKEKGVGAVWDILSGKTTGLPDPKSLGEISLKIPSPMFDSKTGELRNLNPMGRLELPKKTLSARDIKAIVANQNKTKIKKGSTAARKRIYRGDNVKSTGSRALDMILEGKVGHFSRNKYGPGATGGFGG